MNLNIKTRHYLRNQSITWRSSLWFSPPHEQRKEENVWFVSSQHHDTPMFNQSAVWWLFIRTPFATVFGSSKNTFCMKKNTGKVHSIRIMYTQLQCNFHQPLQLKHLLIVDVMTNQQIPVNWKRVQFEIKTLISYNTCNDGITRDSFQIEYGQHVTANRFMAAHYAIDCHRSVVVPWLPIPLHSYMTLECRLSYPQ